MKFNKKNKKQNSSFLMVAILILVSLEIFVLKGHRPYLDNQESDGYAEIIQESVFERQVYEIPVIDRDASRDNLKPLSTGRSIPVHKIKLPENEKVWQKNAVKVNPPASTKKIVIIIDDMGVDRRRTDKVSKLEGPLTLAFLPYARNVSEQADKAKARGHELIVHMPMQPIKSDLDTGPIVLTKGLNDRDFNQMIDKGLSAFDNYVGINNHMGSALTQDKKSMSRVMKILKERELLFVDSRTINTSVAAESAQKFGVPNVTRDIFIDHEPGYAYAKNALIKLEAVANKKGIAIGIGHPKDGTIQALKEWLPTLPEKNITLVPVSYAVFLSPSNDLAAYSQ
jgi:polysaccharide deacetylase 2 family uncharacterized protein YibQ